jgi:anti-sigma factor RsiW
MKDRHILDILDGKRFAELSAEEKTIVNRHAALCPDCGQAAGQPGFSSLLFRAAAENPAAEPPPFFRRK